MLLERLRALVAEWRVEESHGSSAVYAAELEDLIDECEQEDRDTIPAPDAERDTLVDCEVTP